MDKILVILLLGLSYTASAPMVSILGPSVGPHLLKPGNSLDLVCHIEMSMVITYKVHWIHMPSLPNAEPVKLMNYRALMPDVSKDHYAAGVKLEGQHINITLTLKNAVSNMDGKYICRATPLREGDMIEEKTVVVVPSDAIQVTLDFDGEEVSDVNQVPAQREEGKYDVSCRTKGFHPPGSLHLFLGDDLLEFVAEGIPDPASSQAAGAPRSKASIQMKLELQASASGKVLKCVARADYEGAMEKVASMPLEIIALEPEISCDKNASGAPRDRYVKLTCHVNHARVDVDYYRFEIGDTGDFIVQNKTSSNFDIILVHKESDIVDEVTLVIYETKDWHFDTYYYLDVFLKNDQKFREKAKLMRRDTTGGASKPMAYALCLLLSVLVWSL